MPRDSEAFRWRGEAAELTPDIPVHAPCRGHIPSTAGGFPLPRPPDPPSTSGVSQDHHSYLQPDEPFGRNCPVLVAGAKPPGFGSTTSSAPRRGTFWQAPFWLTEEYF